MLIDTHAHLDEERFAADRADVIARAANAGVGIILSIATTAVSSEASQRIAESYPGVFTSAGIHPNYGAEIVPGDWDLVLRYANHPRVRAIGETGLDRFHHFTPFEIQEDYFARHLVLSRRLNRPIVIHSRDCDADMLRMLREDFDRHGPISGVMHSFASNATTATACLEMGLYLSFSGMITYKKSDELRKVAANAPLDRIMVETDCPYLAPTPHRGQRNEPAYVVHTAQTLADLRGVTTDTIATSTTENAIRLFKLQTG